jgi:arylsulfatase A-like enzyme
MGYQTPNIDRIAREGMLFTDSYGEQSCTAGRSSFITGQSVYRTGLSKVGIPAGLVPELSFASCAEASRTLAVVSTAASDRAVRMCLAIDRTPASQA